MARTSVTVQTPTRAGLSPTFSSADGTNGNSVALDGRTVLRIKNGGGSSITATVLFGGSVDGVALTQGKTVTVAAGGDVVTAMWPKDAYAQADGSLYIDWSSATSVTFAALSFSA